jgi:2-keto-4-pentenoate hydratase/2-oxohepta-3-ene-1,7-dioic acid hydratase in catechol pathway
MRLARIQYKGAPVWSIIESETVYALSGDVYGSFRKGAKLCALADAKLLAPAEPTIIVCCGLNYMGEVKHLGAPVPQRPSLFYKPPVALHDPDVELPYPVLTEKLSHEAELCCVMKSVTRNVSEGEALDHVLGFTCGNDLGMMDILQLDGGATTRAKGFDGSAALGPWLETAVNPVGLGIKGRVNGQLIQDSNTSEMLFKPAQIISFISQYLTLRAGDVVYTGTPQNGHYVVGPGSLLEVEIEGIGVLKTPVGEKAKA